jgi:hypothetical protein
MSAQLANIRPIWSPCSEQKRYFRDIMSEGQTDTLTNIKLQSFRREYPIAEALKFSVGHCLKQIHVSHFFNSNVSERKTIIFSHFLCLRAAIFLMMSNIDEYDLRKHMNM